MDHDRFDRITKTLGERLSRRSGIGLLLSGIVAGSLSATDADAKKKKKCKPPTKKCGAKCVRVKTDRNNCGACNRKCAAGQSCTNGRCSCLSGQKPCNGACIPAANCCANGDCGVCQTCQGGACVAAASDPNCGGDCRSCQAGACVNAANDSFCASAASGKCRNGVCNARPNCVTFGNDCRADINFYCCAPEGQTVCATSKCMQQNGPGLRCRFNADCVSNQCMGYVCD